MPYVIKKKKNGKYSLSGPSGVHAKNSSKKKVMAQKRLLLAKEHGWNPTKKIYKGGAK